jgi:hypothetical protein
VREVHASLAVDLSRRDALPIEQDLKRQQVPAWELGRSLALSERAQYDGELNRCRPHSGKRLQETCQQDAGGSRYFPTETGSSALRFCRDLSHSWICAM